MRKLLISLSLTFCLALCASETGLCQAASVGTSFNGIHFTASNLDNITDVALGSKSGIVTSHKLQSFASSVYISLNHTDQSALVGELKNSIQTPATRMSFRARFLDALYKTVLVGSAFLNSSKPGGDKQKIGVTSMINAFIGFFIACGIKKKGLFHLLWINFIIYFSRTLLKPLPRKLSSLILSIGTKPGF